MLVTLTRKDVTNAFVLLAELDPSHYRHLSPDQQRLLQQAQMAKESALAGESVSVELDLRDPSER